MSMIVNSQQVAKLTSLFLDKSHGNLTRGLNRLSTGLRINGSADDAGNLAVSLKLNSSLKRATATYHNIQNGRSFLSMQEGAYKSLGKILDRMGELRTLFDDPVKSWSDKINLDFEFRELQQEVLQMRAAKLNGVSLFSTEDQSQNPFFLPTTDGGARLNVTRTGFFDSLTIATGSVGSTPNFTVAGAVGSMAPQAFSVAPQGTVSTDPTFAVLQGTMASQNLTVATAGSPDTMSSSSATDGLYDTTKPKPAVKIYDGGGAVVATVDPTNVTLNTTGGAKGTVTIDLTTLPAGVTTAGAYDVKADDGDVYLDSADATSAAGNQGSGYLGLPPSVTITGPSGAPVTGDPAAGPLTVDGATFDFAMKAAPDDDKFGIAVSGTPTAAGEFTIQIDDGPMTSDQAAVSSSATTDGLYDTTQAKPDVKIYDNTGTAVATVAAGDVTLNTSGATAGTVTIDLSTLPAGVAAEGTYTVKADDGNVYLDSADATSAAGNQGSGYLGLPPSVTITGPSGAPVTGDPAAGSLTVDGATFAFAMKAAPDDDKFGITVTGTPTAAGEFTIQIDDGPMTSDQAAVSSSATTDGLYDTTQAKPDVKIYDNTGTAVATVAAGDVTLNTSGAAAGTVTIDLSTLPAGVAVEGTYTVKADDGNVYLDSADTTSAAGNQGSGYLGLPPSVTITGPSGALVTGDPAAGSLTVDGATFAFAMKAAPDDDKFGITVSGTPTTAGEFTIQIDDGPDQGSASQSVPTVKGTSTGATGAVTTSVDSDLGRVRGGPALSADGKVLYVSDENGKLLAINTDTGADNWGGTGTLGRTIAPASHIAVGPNGNFYFSSGNSVYAFQDNGASVTELGNFRVNGLTRNSPEVNAANEVFFIDRRSNVFALDGTNPGSWGSFTDLNGVIWSADASTDTSQSSPALSPAGDVVYVGSNDDRVYAYTAPAAGTTGTKLWDTGTLSQGEDADTKPVVDAAGNVYFAASAGGNATINATSAAGVGLWSTAIGQESIVNPILSSDGGTVYVGHSRGMNAYDTANGNERWSYPPTGSAGIRFSQPAESSDGDAVTPGSTIYYGSGRFLHAVDTATGTQKWTFDTGGNIDRTAPVVHPTNGTIFVGSDSQKIFAIRDDGSGSPTQLWESGSGGFKLDASTAQVGKDYLPTETLATSDITLSGTAATGISVNSVTANGDGTFDVGLSGTPTSAGTITISINASANGAVHLADLTDVGTGYPTTMTPVDLAALTVTIAGANPGDEGTLAGTVEGDPVSGGGVDGVTGALKLVKFTGTPAVEGNFTVTIQNGPPAGTASDVNVTALQGTMADQNINVTKAGTAADVGVTALQGTMADQNINVTKAGTAADVGVTALQGNMAAQNLAVGISATPTSFTSSPSTDGIYQAAGAKPAAFLYDGGGVQIATVDPAKVNLNANGTVTIDLTALPTGVTTAGTYTVKADDGPLYLDPASTTVTDVGTGYSAVPSFQVVAPDGAVNPGDVTASLTLAGDKLTVTASGTPAQSGNYEVQIADGPLGASASFLDAGSGYDAAETPAAIISDLTGTPVGTTTTTNNGDGSLRMDLTPLPAGVAAAGNYSAQAPVGTTVATPSPVNVGSGYNSADPTPSVTFPSGPAGTLSAASTSINPSGSVAISFAGNPSGTGPVTVSVSGGSSSASAEGLLNEDLHLWDFSVSDFTRYIHVLSNVRAVNGAETNSFSFAKNLLSNNLQNLQMATGRIVDTDVASEMTELAKNKIKTSTAVDMLAKHNKLSTLVDLTVMNLI